MAPCTSVHLIVWTQATKISYRYNWAEQWRPEGRQTSEGRSCTACFYLTIS